MAKRLLIIRSYEIARARARVFLGRYESCRFAAVLIVAVTWTDDSNDDPIEEDHQHIVGTRLRFQLSAHKLDLKKKMELSLQLLKLSLSRFARFFM